MNGMSGCTAMHTTAAREPVQGGPRWSVEVGRVDAGSWNNVLGSFEDSSIYQSWAWGRERWGEKNLGHVLLRQDGRLAAAAQAWIIKIPLLGFGIAYVKWGPMWHPSAGGPDTERLRLIVRALKEEYALRRGLLLRITPNVTAGNPEEIYTALRDEGFEPGRSTTPYRTIIMDLSHSEEAMRSGLKRQWRQCLKHAEMSGLDIREMSGDESFREVAGLYNEMRGRKKFAEFLDLRNLRAVQRGLPEPYKMEVTACESGKGVVAACVTTKFGTGALGMIAATSPDGLGMHASHVLQWRIIGRLRSRGIRWYDLGGIDPVKYHGPYLFKAGFAGKLGRDATFSDFEYCASGASRRLVVTGDRLRSAYREALEATASARAPGPKKGNGKGGAHGGNSGETGRHGMERRQGDGCDA